MRTTIALACLVLGACAQKDDPATWSRRLDDPKRRAEAIARLEAFRDDAGARPAEVVAPLASAYVRGGLDDGTRRGVLAALAETRDPRAEPVFRVALEDCADGAPVAAHALSDLARAGKSIEPRAASALFSCFVKKPELGADVLAVRSPSFSADAKALLSGTVTSAESFDARGAHKPNQELTRESVALELLAATPDPGATEALVAVLMTREKRTLWPLARVALAKTPGASERTLVAALDGSDPALRALRATWARDDGYVPNLAEALADLGSASARDALLRAAPTLTNDANRAAVAETLTWFPATPELVTAYQRLFARLPPVARATKDGKDTGLERAALLQTSADLFEPRLVDWVLAESKDATGLQMIAARAGALESAIKLMQPPDAARVADAVDAFVNRSGLPKMERSEIGNNLTALYAWANKALAQCEADVGCHLRVLDEPIPGDSHANWKAIKSATMCGLLGDATTREALVARLGGVKNAGVRRAMARAIDHLAPAGDVRDATALEALATAESLGPDDTVTRVGRMLRARVGR